jgi:glycosyltransferase involved in cell wall biosynthesis
MNDIGMFQVARIAREAGVATVMHVRGVMDQDSRWVLRLLRSMARKWVMQTVAIDESVRLGLRQVTDSVVVYNPLPRDLLEAPAVVGAARSDPVRVTFLNTLIGYKGIYDLLDSARLLRDRGDILFQVAGTNSRPVEFHNSLIGRISRILGLTRDVEADAKDFLARHGLQDRVRMLGRVDPGAVLQETDVLVFPSHLNGAGRSVFEAGVLGIPAILTLRDRVEDIVQDGVTGLIVPESDPGALAAAIARLADDPVLRSKLGAEARRRYLLQFDGREIGREVMALYRGVLSDPTAGASRRDPDGAAAGTASRGSG